VLITCNLGNDDYTDNSSISVLFVKRSSDPLSESNISKCVNVQTVQGSPMSTLLNSLKGVWCPALLDNAHITEKLPPRIKHLLAELEATLSSSVSSGDGSVAASTNGKVDIESISDILETSDEFAFWMKLKEDRRSPYKDLARQVDSALAEFATFNDLNSLDISAVGDVVNLSLDVLNNVWSCTVDGLVYPQIRMAHLFDRIGNALCKYIQAQLASVDIWSRISSTVRMKLQSAISICEKWCDVPRRLTSTFWSGANHRWKGSPHEDEFTRAFMRRLDQVYNILVLSDELSRILTSEEKSSFQLEKLFEPLMQTKPILYNPYTEPKWIAAVREYESLIDPVETAVAARFRRNIAPLLDRPRQLLNEFQKFKNLLKRPAIRRVLISERETLLSLLREQVKRIESIVDREDYTNNHSDDESKSSGGKSKDTSGSITVGARLMSTHVTAICSLRQLGSRVSSMYNLSKELLYDLEAFSKYQSQCETLLARMKTEEDNKFDAWLSDMKSGYDDGEDASRALSLTLQGSPLSWKGGVLVVNFSEQLVRFLRDFRQLDELGFDMPKASSGGKSKTLADKAIEAEKYFRYGLLLKKTANFYNSISEQMIDVQEQLLLNALTQFSDIVTRPTKNKRDGGDLTWSNPADCESYIKSLQESAEKLASENRLVFLLLCIICASSTEWRLYCCGYVDIANC
jgi:dynein heavy chain 2